MNHQVNAINGRMSLRSPQLKSIEILDRVTELVPLQKQILKGISRPYVLLQPPEQAKQGLWVLLSATCTWCMG